MTTSKRNEIIEWSENPHVNPNGVAVTYRRDKRDALRGIPKGVTLGDDVKIHKDVTIADACIIDESVVLREGSRLEYGARITMGAHVGPKAYVGPGAFVKGNVPAEACVPRDSVQYLDLGHDPREYRISMGVNAQGVPRFIVGCRDFDLAEAVNHWGSNAIDEDLMHEDRTSAQFMLATVLHGAAMAKLVWPGLYPAKKKRAPAKRRKPAKKRAAKKQARKPAARKRATKKRGRK